MPYKKLQSAEEHFPLAHLKTLPNIANHSEDHFFSLPYSTSLLYSFYSFTAHENIGSPFPLFRSLPLHLPISKAECYMFIFLLSPSFFLKQFNALTLLCIKTSMLIWKIRFGMHFLYKREANGSQNKYFVGFSVNMYFAF